jgi:glucuronokinase
MESRGYGEYEHLDPNLLSNVYLAYRTSLSEGTEVFHNNVRERWRGGDPIVVRAMETWAGYASEGRKALLERDTPTLERLINANFNLRSELYGISEGNLEMIKAARSVGASANFAGSGGAIVGLYKDEAMFKALEQAMKPYSVAVIKPTVTARPQ